MEHDTQLKELSHVVFRAKKTDQEWLTVLAQARHSHPSLIAVEITARGLWVSTCEETKLGCPNCLSYYHRERLLFPEELKNKEIIGPIARALTEKVAESPYQLAVHVTPDGQTKLYRLFPHPDCGNCTKHHHREMPPLQVKDLIPFRQRDLGAIQALWNSVPLGAVSVFKDLQVYTYKGLAIARLQTELSCRTEYGIGRSFDQQAAASVALLEAVERLALNGSMGDAAGVMASYNQMPNAIHPHHLLGGEWASKFEEEKPFLWVQGTSLMTGEAVTVPAQLIFFENEEILHSRGECRFHHTTSNGTAVGSHAIEAAFYALQEVWERHRALTVWQEKEGMTCWPLHLFANEDKIAHLLDYFQKEGCQVQIINTGGESLLSTVWVHLRWVRGQVNAIGSGIDPHKAVLGALVELFTGYLNFRQITTEQAQRTEVLLDSLESIQRMEDHVLFYLHPSQREKFTFLDRLPIEEASYKNGMRQGEGIREQGLTKALERMTEECSQRGQEIVAFDVTPAWVRKIDPVLCVVKVMIKNSCVWQYGFSLEREPHPFL
ncbi:YcaO-like family protein [Effusibacillus consociatus]|uniref:YcaO-like family protein n=1 Tax=Effusibacillus consociatus TaxID=1117041 RepID=A0ABV9Q1I0_9BACL